MDATSFLLIVVFAVLARSAVKAMAEGRIKAVSPYRLWADYGPETVESGWIAVIPHDGRPSVNVSTRLIAVPSAEQVSRAADDAGGPDKLAEAIGVSARAVSYWIKGERRPRGAGAIRFVRYVEDRR